MSVPIFNSFVCAFVLQGISLHAPVSLSRAVGRSVWAPRRVSLAYQGLRTFSTVFQFSNSPLLSNRQTGSETHKRRFSKRRLWQKVLQKKGKLETNVVSAI